MPDTWLSNTQGNIHVLYEPVIGRGKAYIQIALNYFICKKIIWKTISTLYFFFILYFDSFGAIVVWNW